MPSTITPSTGIASPGLTRTMSPTFTSSARIISSTPSCITRAVRGVIEINCSIPARAFPTVTSPAMPRFA